MPQTHGTLTGKQMARISGEIKQARRMARGLGLPMTEDQLKGLRGCLDRSRGDQTLYNLLLKTLPETADRCLGEVGRKKGDLDGEIAHVSGRVALASNGPTTWQKWTGGILAGVCLLGAAVTTGAGVAFAEAWKDAALAMGSWKHAQDMLGILGAAAPLTIVSGVLAYLHLGRKDRLWNRKEALCGKRDRCELLEGRLEDLPLRVERYTLS